MRRRTLLFGVPPIALAAATGGWLWAGADTSTAGKVSFVNRLAIPPLAASRRDAAGRRVFDLRAQRGKSSFLPGPATPTWGFNGDYLGPTLRAVRGESVLVNVTNALGEETTVHWHGMHLPAAMDGGPHQPIAPGATWSPTWTVRQPAATLWYHPHPHGATARHVYRGLAGLFIIDEKDGLLPQNYGVDDIPVILQDRSFTSDNELDETQGFMNDSGVLGDTMLVNGTAAPYLEVTTSLVRLRVLNACNARVLNLGLVSGATFTLVGTDGGLLSTPHPMRRLQLSPGERAEIVLALPPGSRDVLRGFPPDLGADLLTTRFNGGEDSFDILQLRAAPKLTPSPPLPATLAAPPALGPPVATRRFEIVSFSINGKPMDMGRVDTVVTKDTTEVWEITNIDDLPHNFHVHDVQFQVLTVAGRKPPPELSGWKDTVYVPPQTTVRIALRFADFADPRTPYMYHCHLLWHEDNAMMGQFVVVSEGGGQPHLEHGAGTGTGEHH
ncbi:multicopper oxidase family protein [Nonomuraea sp. NPDC050556]|uniref:multicopper oxidase family protein n=1 Tax=Nonomuraea sp. NPDC050556 TaxID=3364369 RepID=UPI0037A96D5F